MERTGHDTPEQLVLYRQRMAGLWPANLEAWRVFHELSASRPVGMVAGGIPQSEILCWFILRGRNIDPLLVEKLMALDRIFLAHQAKQTPKEGQGNGHAR